VRKYLLALLLAGCPAPKPPPLVHVPRAHEPSITWKRVESPDDVPNIAPPAGTYRIHLIDVGTGLSILIQGADFTMLYDAGSNDREETPMRVLAYLDEVLGGSGDDSCGTPGDKKPIDHVVLSHPHFDHASAMDLVVHCFDVKNVWDAGRVNDAVFYRNFLEAVSRSTAHYHTAASVPPDHVVGVKGEEIEIHDWQRFSEGDTVELGRGARFTILHADPKKLPDPNQNSVVVDLDLGGARVLLVGDAESGERRDPSYPAGDVEEFLLDHHRQEIAADILQVGHHGSKTSSRHAFLAAVHPTLALVSSGPKVYGKAVLPDPEVIDELRADGATILRTDARDEKCPVQQRLGGDTGPGGCDSYVITIAPGK
jgi:competence protein ComEC